MTLPPLSRLQSAAIGLAAVGILLGFLASIDVWLLPPLAVGWTVLFHPLLLAVGAAGGTAAVGRGRELDAERWQVVDDALATKGERELAHREAERQRRLAATAFLAGPVFLGYWLLYQTGPTGFPSWLLPGSALLGYFAAFVLANRRLGPERSF
ncbi:MAG TPA: hypothetical protein VHQ65_14220 [Thermoanaerobaculia bacterium]|nr:hypothetical protein [Thermoanaerobaculia bacterium]